MGSFERTVQKFIEEHQLIEEGDRLLIACSGGIDSMALLHFFINFQQQTKIELFVTHVDHMLRGEASAQDRFFVEEFCKQHNIPIYATSIPIPEILQKEGGNSQAVCRRERYAFFEQVMKEQDIHKLVTAHHADDQLESLLMSFTRARTMKGIRSKREIPHGVLIRPFLGVTKLEIREYLEGSGGTYREDSSNAKDDYTRNRFRHHIVPLLKKENPNVSLNAVQVAEDLQQDNDFLTELAQQRFSSIINKVNEKGYSFSINTLQKEPVALQKRIILILLNYLYNDSNINQSQTICNSIMNLCKKQDGSALLHLPEGYEMKRQYGEITLYKKTTEETKETQILLMNRLSLNEWTEPSKGFRLYIGDTSHVLGLKESKYSQTYYFNSKVFSSPFLVRSRKEGDRISLKGMNEKKRLSRLFIDEKIPLDERDTWPVLVDSKDEVIAVLGIRQSKELSKEKRPSDDMVVIIQTGI